MNTSMLAPHKAAVSGFCIEAYYQSGEKLDSLDEKMIAHQLSNGTFSGKLSRHDYVRQPRTGETVETVETHVEGYWRAKTLRVQDVM